MTDKAAKSVPTLQDVASRAGVSTATVSRCLNTPDQVIPKTRDKVMTAVKELGYAPNFSARALAAKRTNTVGAVIPTMDNAIFARGLQAFQEELSKHNMTLLVASSQYDAETEDRQIRNLIARGADALFLIGYDRAPEIYRLLENRDIPAVVAWAYDEARKVPSVGFDNRTAMKQLAAEIIALGHRDLGFISANRSHNDRARARVDGVCAAMTDAGLDPGTLQVIETTYSIESGAETCTTLLSGTNRPSAIICGNDVLAVGAIGAAQAMGLAVPDDVSVTGFDDIELSQVTSPPLTTVHVPHRDMGRKAAQLLMALLDGRDTEQFFKLETSLRLRDTLGRFKQIL